MVHPSSALSFVFVVEKPEENEEEEEEEKEEEESIVNFCIQHPSVGLSIS